MLRGELRIQQYYFVPSVKSLDQKNQDHQDVPLIKYIIFHESWDWFYFCDDFDSLYNTYPPQMIFLAIRVLIGRSADKSQSVTKKYVLVFDRRSPKLSIVYKVVYIEYKL